MTWKCPNCKSDEHLEIAIPIWVRLRQDPEDPSAFETEYTGGDHEWDSESQMFCGTCDTWFTAGQAEVKEENEDE